MDNTPNETVVEERPKVGFPEAPEEKRGFNFKALILVVILLLLLGGGAWFLFGKTGMDLTQEETSPTATPEVIEEESPTPTVAAESLDKESVKVQILNGTGIPGAAGKMQDILKGLGYKNFELGNASNYSYKSTEVSFSDKIPSTAKQEIISELEKTYETVEESDTKPATADVKIVTGFTKGTTPTVTPKAKATTSVSPTPTSKLSVSPTKTPTPTP